MFAALIRGVDGAGLLPSRPEACVKFLLTRDERIIAFKRMFSGWDSPVCSRRPAIPECAHLFKYDRKPLPGSVSFA
jgi:hypothetical protein